MKPTGHDATKCQVDAVRHHLATLPPLVRSLVARIGGLRQRVLAAYPADGIPRLVKARIHVEDLRARLVALVEIEPEVLDVLDKARTARLVVNGELGLGGERRDEMTHPSASAPGAMAPSLLGRAGLVLEDLRRIDQAAVSLARTVEGCLREAAVELFLETAKGGQSHGKRDAVTAGDDSGG